MNPRRRSFFRALMVGALAGVLHPGLAAETRAPRLFLIGGSTMATFPPERPVVGWGQMLPQFFKDPAQIENHARSGRSSKSLIDEGHWAKTIDDIRAGDFLIMCWGTNDSSSDPKRRTEPRGEFAANLRRFIREIRAKGATPILATQIAHRRWNDKGEWIETASDYVRVNRELSASERVPLLELYDRTTALEKSLGVEGSRALHLHFAPGEHPAYPDGAKDDTHHNAHGATRVAEVVVAEIRRLRLPLVAWLREER